LITAMEVAAALLVCAAAGCAPNLSGLDPNMLGVALPDSPGSTFETAGALDANGNAAFNGTISMNQADVYDLGPVAPGDRIIASVGAAAGSRLDTTLAIFDERGELFALNDDVDLNSGMLGSAIDDVVVTAGQSCYLAVSKFFSDKGGAYEGTVRIERGGAIPTPPLQVLLLNFDGGSATIASAGTLNLNPFDAADIDTAYAGETQTIKDKIVAIVRDSFLGTGLQVVTTDQNLTLTPGTFSTIHFGTFSATLFGAADNVDQGNRDCCDDGIVFTDGFDEPFAQQPSAAGIGTAIGNVAAHEAGHLLGLNHVADVTALMDSTGTASTLLAIQLFKTAPLTEAVFPIGMQNAPSILERVVPAP
jgi:hypothetical protein